jgi:hypothetical protein
MRDQEWFKDFCMIYNTFVKLCDILKPYIEHQDTNYRDAVHVHKAVAMVLRKLAYGLIPKILRDHILVDCCLGTL